MAYIVVGMLAGNEEMYVRHSVGAVYDFVDEIIVVNSSTDNTVKILKELDVDNKIKIIDRKWDNNYASARNTYLDYIFKNIFPKHKTDLYYFRIDFDEVMYTSKMVGLRDSIEDNPDAMGFRFSWIVKTQPKQELIYLS